MIKVDLRVADKLVETSDEASIDNLQPLRIGSDVVCQEIQKFSQYRIVLGRW